MKPDSSPAEAAEWPSRPGIYLLIFELAAPQAFDAGALGRVTLASGRYVYVGSAFGPGGLRARLNRHQRQDKRLHWHVDYLTSVTPLAGIVARAGAERSECVWARRLLALPGATTPIVGFGSSDCRENCPAHLIGVPDDFDWTHWESQP